MLSQPSEVQQPWGTETWIALTDRYAGRLMEIRAGERLSLHAHQVRQESGYLLSGSVRILKVGADGMLDSYEVAPGEAWHHHPGELHSIVAIEDSVVLEISTPEIDDVVRLDDRYGREAVSSTSIR